MGGVPSFLDVGGHFKFTEWNIIVARRKTKICGDEAVHAIDREVGGSESHVIGLILRNVTGLYLSLLCRCQTFDLDRRWKELPIEGNVDRNIDFVRLQCASSYC